MGRLQRSFFLEMSAHEVDSELEAVNCGSLSRDLEILVQIGSSIVPV